LVVPPQPTTLTHRRPASNNIAIIFFTVYHPFLEWKRG
jgi:hypothetical protein